jgi:integrase/recombinase XerD
MLTIYRRHLKNCEHRGEGRKYRRCNCPLWADGFLNGVELRKALDLRDWTKAQGIVREWESNSKAGETVRVEAKRAVPRELLSGIGNQEATPPTVKDACEKFIADAEARGLREPTIYKFRLLFRRLQEFAELNGLRYLSQFDIDQLRQFRATWPNRNFAAQKKLEALRTFFRFGHDSGWISCNVAAKLKPPKIVERPTMPLSRGEVARILAACDNYPDKLNTVRLRALILLLRYSGLRIRDAVTLPRERINNSRLFLYTAKTGTAVYCPLPPFVTSVLEAIPKTGNYFFWTGESKPKSAVGNWQRSLKRLFELAGVPTAHAHRFRDTFSVELLQAGVPIERVSVLLGHRSVQITERHYNAWTRARQEQAEADVRRTWGEVPPETKGTREVREENTFVN